MPFNYFETDAQTVSDQILSSLADEVQENLYPGDERRIMGDAIAMVMVQIFNYLDDQAKQRLLRYAKGEVLDAIAENALVERIPPSPATDIAEFTLSAEQDRNIVIPEGTRVTHDGIIYFTTDKVAIIKAGELSAEVSITCMTAGEDYNGIEPGEINVIVDPLPYVMEVTNLNGTDGGDSGEAYTDEGDDKLRTRVQIASAASSTAGPEDAYIFHTLSVDTDIVDAYIDSPAPNEIVIYPILAGGVVPGKEILDAVTAFFHRPDKKIRPMCDKVTAAAPTEVEYDIEFKYYVTVDKEKEAVNLVEMESGMIDAYIDWQSQALGRNIDPDGLRRELFQDSPELGIVVERAEIISPQFTELKKNEIAKFSGNLKVSHEVIQ